MKYAEVSMTLSTGHRATLLLRFDNSDERDAAAYDFLQMGAYRGDRVTWEDLTWREARRLYDLRRFGTPRYNIGIEIFDYRSGDPMATRRISGIEMTSEASARLAREAKESAEAALRALAN
jgi:hypothetical protein